MFLVTVFKMPRSFRPTDSEKDNLNVFDKEKRLVCNTPAMKLVVFSAVFLLAATTGNANPVLLSFLGPELDVVCPYRYSQPANSGWESCYKVFPEFKSRREAAAQCRSDGGTLASVSSAFVNSYLNYLGTQMNTGSFWLGVECFNGDVKTCMNDDGSSFTYSNFRPGEPRPDGECIYTSASGRDSQQWLSFDCGQKFQFACEVKAAAPVVPTTTSTKAPPTSSTTKKAYLSTRAQKTTTEEVTTTFSDTTTTLDTTTFALQDSTSSPTERYCPGNYTPFQSMCYSFVYLYPISANRATSLCRQVWGGMLATIPNPQVNSFLRSIRPIGSNNAVFGLVCPNIQYSGDRRSCKWQDGSPFNYQAFYDQGFPRTQPGSGCCDFNFGSWEDCYNCDSDRFDSYICQSPMYF